MYHPTFTVKWTSKQIAGSASEQRKLLLALLAVGLIGSLLFTWPLWDIFDQYPVLFFSILATIWIFVASMIGAARQRTTYFYLISRTNGVLTYSQCDPEWASSLMKVFVLSVITVLVMTALVTGSILFLIGPCVIATLSAIRILAWQHPVKQEKSLPWHMYNHVTVDRKQRFIVTHVSDLTLGFEARLPDEETFETYLAFLRSVLPPDAEFLEKKWELSMI